MKVKELKISPVPEKKSLRFVAHWLMMMPILPFIFLGIIYYVIDKNKVFSGNIKAYFDNGSLMTKDLHKNDKIDGTVKKYSK